MTGKEIKKALPFWQKALKLEDWTICVRQGKAAEMKLDGVMCDGLNYFSPEELTSEILLARGVKEDTLIHELCHLVLDGDKPKKRYDILHERAINRLAMALMGLKEMIPNE